MKSFISISLFYFAFFVILRLDVGSLITPSGVLIVSLALALRYTALVSSSDNILISYSERKGLLKLKPLDLYLYFKIYTDFIGLR